MTFPHIRKTYAQGLLSQDFTFKEKLPSKEDGHYDYGEMDPNQQENNLDEKPSAWRVIKPPSVVSFFLGIDFVSHSAFLVSRVDYIVVKRPSFECSVLNLLQSATDL